jgi:hypothetical protein
VPHCGRHLQCSVNIAHFLKVMPYRRSTCADPKALLTDAIFIGYAKNISANETGQVVAFGSGAQVLAPEGVTGTLVTRANGGMYLVPTGGFSKVSINNQPFNATTHGATLMVMARATTGVFGKLIEVVQPTRSFSILQGTGGVECSIADTNTSSNSSSPVVVAFDAPDDKWHVYACLLHNESLLPVTDGQVGTPILTSITLSNDDVELKIGNSVSGKDMQVAAAALFTSLRAADVVTVSSICSQENGVHANVVG